MSVRVAHAGMHMQGTQRSQKEPWLLSSTMVKRSSKGLFNKETRNYLMSTHFWGPVFNWMIPIAAISDTQKHPRIISGKMTLALALSSAIFMRFAWKVQPRNLLLLACHLVNTSAQLVQGYRFIDYHYYSQEGSVKE
ncbi:mitochondrial pyruvate carrier 1-like [Colletes gigas]|uniref:mitochondrial pyruvate carrier 1-like n=1 Tax=Colletes gigas TaxID=935657 RepID=UPI001C9B1CCF|nr:mitochondrial pyruvate carrier 1-like [Colletes gigas]